MAPFPPMTAHKKKRLYKLGTMSPLFDGWTLDQKGLWSPELQRYTPADLYVWHWRLQILARIQNRINRPHQLTMEW